MHHSFLHSTNQIWLIQQQSLLPLQIRHEQKEIVLMEFIHGLSTLVAKNSKTVV
jgi:hypothetical protein